MASSRRTRFSLEVLQARQGDCLLLHFGTASRPGLLLIDGGPSGVYSAQLRPRLVAMREARRPGDDQPLPIDAVLVSHIDDDHIRGVLELTRELRTQVGDRAPQLVQVDRLWHNAFDDLLGTTPTELRAEAAAAATAGMTAPSAGAADPAIDRDVTKILASIAQGRTLRDDAALLEWSVNSPFGGLVAAKPAGADGRPARVALGNLRITVIGPMDNELAALQAAHDDFLRRQPSTPAGVPAAFVDRSIPNLSSIVLLIEAGGHRMLLTGDARGDKIVAGLEASGVLKKTPRSRLHLDVLKVPHHGSANNVETSFFKRVTADHYVFSGNGMYGNPEREALAMLWAARGTAAFTIHLTYPVTELDAARRIDWEQAREAERRAGDPARPAWSEADNSLAAFLDANLAAGQSVAVAGKRPPHLIQLLAPV